MTDRHILRVGFGKLVGVSGSNHCEAQGGSHKLFRLEKVPFKLCLLWYIRGDKSYFSQESCPPSPLGFTRKVLTQRFGSCSSRAMQ